MPFRTAAFDEGIRFVTRCAELSGEQPTFQRTSTRAPRRLQVSEAFARKARECRVSWRFTRFGSRVFAGETACCSDSVRESAFL